MAILLCTDLDRTLLPNGPQPESPGARLALTQWLRDARARLAFVSGRRLDLQLQAITHYSLPTPDHIVADVGATVYDRGDDGQWLPNAGWHATLDHAWQGREWRDVAPLLTDIPGLALQEESAQAPHKLSFNVIDPTARDRLVTQVAQRLEQAGIHSDLIWSVDETVPTGLLDVMAKGATKLNAVRWLIESTHTPIDQVLFAGDSGNDLPVLVSDIPAVLVANATDEVRREALHLSQHGGHPSQLHLATGTPDGFNGCYAAGILEGLHHYFPHATRRFTTA